MVVGKENLFFTMEQIAATPPVTLPSHIAFGQGFYALSTISHSEMRHVMLNKVTREPLKTTSGRGNRTCARIYGNGKYDEGYVGTPAEWPNCILEETGQAQSDFINTCQAIGLNREPGGAVREEEEEAAPKTATAGAKK
jgi:hypothetical protein